MQDLKISIITVVYNNVFGIKQTIQSVISQTYSNIEYIIIDGGSTDGSLEIIETFNNHKILVISEKDSGIYNAMNKGWRIATGEYCLFLNSGDYLFDEIVIERAVSLIQKSAADIFFGNLHAFDEKQNWVSVFPEPVSLYYFQHSFIPHPSTFAKRSLLEKLSGFYEHYSIISDWAFFIRALLSNATFKQIDLTVTSFYMKGVSSNGEKSRIEKELLFGNEFKFLAEDFKNFERLRHFDTSVLTRLALFLSKLKMKFFG